jgi:protein-tyrosine phosphatase
MTVRTPRPDFIVCGLTDSFRVGPGVDLVVDCCGKGGVRPNGIIVIPTAGDHRWSNDDLDRIVGAVVPRLRAGHRVLIHCRSGRSRSTTAAAAVLMAMGESSDLDDAVRRSARNAGADAPDRRSLVSLRAWWERRQPSLFW